MGTSMQTGLPHVLRLQLFLDGQLVPVEATELVDLVLVLAADLDLFAHGLLLLLRQLRSEPPSARDSSDKRY